MDKWHSLFCNIVVLYNIAMSQIHEFAAGKCFSLILLEHVTFYECPSVYVENILEVRPIAERSIHMQICFRLQSHSTIAYL